MQLKRIEDPLIFYRLSKTLGEGAYGKVKLAYHLLVREKVAVKIFERAKIQEPHAKKRVAREIRILKALDHPNIIRLYEEVDTPQRKFLMMQFVSGGDLCRYVREKRRLDESEACQLFVQIVNGLEYCHRSGIVHRDIKLDNLLIDEHKNIKIVDFGFSVSFKEGQQLRKACGSPSYAAPEIVSRKPYYPTAIDVWSLGVVLYAMVAGYFPFQATDAKELCSKICKGKFTCPDFMSKECQSLVESMLTVEPEKRTSLYKTRGHTWCKAAFERAGPAPVVQRPIDSERSQDSMMPPTTAVAVDPAVVNKLTGFGLDHTLVTQCVQHRMHNLVCTCYDLLVARQEKTRQRAASGHPAASPAPSAAASAATTAAPETPTPPACRMMV
jgi:5'-AMP-activated protein kinase catalytic alpha subunit